MTRLNDEQLNTLFNEPRTVNAFTEQPVTDEQLQKIQEIAYLGPTASIASRCASPGKDPGGSRAPGQAHDGRE